MKILVTGANGYIGRHVVCQLLEQGPEFKQTMQQCRIHC